MTKLVHSTILLLLPLFILGQSIPSQVDLQSFVTIYMEAKEQKMDNDSLLSLVLKDFNMTRDDLRVMQKENLTHEEKERMLKLKRMASTYQEAHQNKVLQQLCRTYDLPIADYKSMLLKYKAEIGFQQELRPYFSQYLESKKK